MNHDVEYDDIQLQLVELECPKTNEEKLEELLVKMNKVLEKIKIRKQKKAARSV